MHWECPRLNCSEMRAAPVWCNAMQNNVLNILLWLLAGTAHCEGRSRGSPSMGNTSKLIKCNAFTWEFLCESNWNVMQCNTKQCFASSLTWNYILMAVFCCCLLQWFILFSLMNLGKNKIISLVELLRIFSSVLWHNVASKRSSLSGWIIALCAPVLLLPSVVE